MPNYRKLYIQLFAAASDALEAIEACNYGRAKEILTTAQHRAQEQYAQGENVLEEATARQGRG